METNLGGARAWLWTALAGVALLWLTMGCTVGLEAPEPPAYAVDVPVAAPSATYYIDPTCAAGTDELEACVAEGFALWQDFDVRVIESDGPAPGAVRVCFGDEGHGDRIGSASWNDQHNHDGIWFRVGDYDPAQYARVAAHEMGHIVMSSPEHLPEGERGIMASTVDYQTDDWSPADVELIESLL